MSKVEEKTPAVCERCDKESTRTIELTAPGGRVERVCWSCLYRQEKRINVSERWRRGRRG
ncbi:MAG TPA: hypothetical protein VJT82_08320 [Pyrinomonadaceae bacterium]|nr:hypothetical protein [Pyrinomonadaceae bacterium]